MQTLPTPASILDRHEHIALQFSGGKDSLAVAYLQRPFWDRLTFYHGDSGDLLPEVREIVDQIAALVPQLPPCREQLAAVDLQAFQTSTPCRSRSRWFGNSLDIAGVARA